MKISKYFNKITISAGAWSTNYITVPHNTKKFSYKIYDSDGTLFQSVGIYDIRGLHATSSLASHSITIASSTGVANLEGTSENVNMGTLIVLIQGNAITAHNNVMITLTFWQEL